MATRYEYAGNVVRELTLELSGVITRLGRECPELETLLCIERTLGLVAAEFAQKQSDAPMMFAPASVAPKPARGAPGTKVLARA